MSDKISIKMDVRPEESEEDVHQAIESLRPKNFDEYIGQTKVKENLKLYIQSAKLRSQALDHCLFSGPPGLGKTSLAQLIACELNTRIHTAAGPTLEKKGDLAAILTSLQPGDILFIDEIHRLSAVVEEVLYPAMEDFKLDVIIGSGPGAQSVRIDLPRFTLIGATTRAGMLTTPLRDRFGIVERLEFYSDKDLATIVSRSSKILKIAIDAAGALLIASRSRGTPRIANRLLKRVRDVAIVQGAQAINEKIATEALERFEIDHLGLDPADRYLLRTVLEKFQGGPVGIESIAAALSEDRGTIEDVIEPYLIQQGMLIRTPRGRIIGPRGYEHLGLPKPIQLTSPDA